MKGIHVPPSTSKEITKAVGQCYTEVEDLAWSQIEYNPWIQLDKQLWDEVEVTIGVIWKHVADQAIEDLDETPL